MISDLFDGYILRQKRVVYLLLMISVFIFGGCSSMYRTTGKAVVSFTEKQALPYIMNLSDFTMVCATTESLTPLLLSFESVEVNSDKLKIMFYMTSGSCIESLALEQELRYLRAVNSQQAAEAQDARILQKRLLKLAAERHFQSFRSLQRQWPMVGVFCPELKPEQELYWLVGLLGGVQALFLDIASDGEIGVPLDIGGKVARSMSCIEAERWWGVPLAVQAAVWANVPGVAPDGVDPYAELAKASQIGTEQRIGLAQFLEAQVFLGAGKVDRVKEIIRDYADRSATTNLNEPREKQLLDAMAYQRLLAISDVLWTEHQGKRTIKFGQFWDDVEIKGKDSLDIDDFL